MHWRITVPESVRSFRHLAGGNVVLMFDGFDEISLNYEKIVISLILGNG
jgi:hypothetical protein